VDAELLRLGLEQVLAGGVLEDEGVPKAQRLTVDLERALATFGLDLEVLADREHLLAHAVARCASGLVSV
jgi:hypothetical protein